MLAFTVLLAATGLALGLRFNVFVLALLLLLATTSIFAIGIWGGGNPLVVALNLLVTLASVQIPNWLPNRCTVSHASQGHHEPDANAIFTQIICGRGYALTRTACQLFRSPMTRERGHRGTGRRVCAQGY
jgi:hypothetical protein